MTTHLLLRSNSLVLRALAAASGVALLCTAAACEESAGGIDGDNARKALGSTDGGSELAEGGDAATPLSLETQARNLFAAIEPDLNARCGTCHITSVANAPKFLDAQDGYKAIREYRGIVVTDYSTSRLLLVGRDTGHSGGPGLEGDLKAKAVVWLRTEAQLLTEQQDLTTTAFALSAGANEVDLSSVTGAAAGAVLRFDAALQGNIATLTNVRIAAPATAGVHVTGPRFVVVTPAGDKADPVDSLGNVDQPIAPGATVTLGTGTVVLTNYSPGASLAVRFRGCKPASLSGDGGVGGGAACKALPQFESNVVPQLQACLNCHGPNGANRGSLDLAALGANNAAACVQALTRVNLQNRPASPILIRPKQGTGHPFAVGNPGAYDAALLAWINAE
jgi:cytochrome c553